MRWMQGRSMNRGGNSPVRPCMLGTTMLRVSDAHFRKPNRNGPPNGAAQKRVPERLHHRPKGHAPETAGSYPVASRLTGYILSAR